MSKIIAALEGNATLEIDRLITKRMMTTTLKNAAMANFLVRMLSSR